MRGRLIMGRAIALTGLLLTGTVLGWVIAVGWPVVAADAISLEPRWRINQLQEGRSQFDLAQWNRTHEKLKQALNYTPENAMLHDYMASLYVIQGRAVWSDTAARRTAFLDARRHYELSLRLRPASGRTWAAMAGTLAALGAADDALFNACEKAIFYSPHDPAVHRQVLRLALSRWANAPDDLKTWVKTIYADPAKRRAYRMNELMKSFNQESL